jgi:hypothetical protein
MSRSGGVLGALTVAGVVSLAWACGSTTGGPGVTAGSDAGAAERGATDTDASGPDLDASPAVDASDAAATSAGENLEANRDRLLTTYLAYLKATPGAQSNGLDGSKLAGVCELWRALVPAAQGVYLTLSARMQGSVLSTDGSSMLSHVTKVYRIAPGDGATKIDPGMCGGGEGNRIIVSMDIALHASLIAASTTKGQPNASGKPDIADILINTTSFWRDSHDLGGAHAPFDLSDETENGGPRGQVQYFSDVTTAPATAPLGRTDLTTLVDPYALEMDQDYDCPHNSNPLCAYTSYGTACLPGPSKLGIALYTARYGDYDPTWQPVDCAGK